MTLSRAFALENWEASTYIPTCLLASVRSVRPPLPSLRRWGVQGGRMGGPMSEHPFL